MEQLNARNIGTVNLAAFAGAAVALAFAVIPATRSVSVAIAGIGILLAIGGFVIAIWKRSKKRIPMIAGGLSFLAAMIATAGESRPRDHVDTATRLEATPAAVKPAERRTALQMVEGYDPSLAPKREKLMQTLKAEGLITKLTCVGVVGRANVTGKFLLLDVDDKKTFAAAMFAWCLDQNPKSEVLVLQSHLNEKKIGTFSPGTGGLSMD